MPIDNCPYSFKDLAANVLPGHYKRLELAMKAPVRAATLVGYKSVAKKLLEALKRTGDFPGCYVFVHEEKLVYVGIPRGVIKRLVQHLNYDSHFSASLVYRIATED